MDPLSRDQSRLITLYIKDFPIYNNGTSKEKKSNYLMKHREHTVGESVCEEDSEDGLGAVYLIGKIKRFFALRSLRVYMIYV